MLQKSYLDVLSINLPIKIEQVQLQKPFSGFMLNRRSDTDVHNAAMLLSVQPCLRRVNTVRRKLFIMGSQVCRGKTQAPAQLFAFGNRSKYRKFAPQKRRCEFQSPALDCGTNQGAADHLLSDKNGSDAAKFKPQFWR